MNRKARDVTFHEKLRLVGKADPHKNSIGRAGGTNTYAYADGNPAKFTDRLGLEDSQIQHAALARVVGRTPAVLYYTDPDCAAAFPHNAYSFALRTLKSMTSR